MAGKYIDFQFQKNDYGEAISYTESAPLVLAIRNILLSRPGNFPFNPSIGVNIKKYQFDILDETEISAIQKEIDRAIVELVPDAHLVKTTVRKIDQDNKSYLGISVSADISGEDTTANFVLLQEGNDIKIFNETY